MTGAHATVLQRLSQVPSNAAESLPQEDEKKCGECGRKGRVTPQMQEQDPRRDVLGAIGKIKRTIAIEPEKEPQSILRDAQA